MLSCKAKKATSSETDTSVAQTDEPKAVVLDMNYQQPKENGNFEILNASIDGDILTLEVSYSGGCEEHEFNAYFNGLFMKSMPPKASIFIHHIDHGDNCRSVVTETLKFQLDAVKSPSKSSDYTVMVGMNGYEGFLTYKY